MMAALQVLAAMRQNEVPLSSLCKDIPLYPSVAANVAVHAKVPLEDCPTLCQAQADARQRLGDAAGLSR